MALPAVGLMKMIGGTLAVKLKRCAMLGKLTITVAE